MKKISNLSELLAENVNSLYNAEQQEREALQRFGKKVNSPELKLALQDYKNRKTEQIDRVKKSLDILHIKPVSREDNVIEDMIEYAISTERRCDDNHLAEAGLIGCLQQMNHYYIGKYGTAAAHAKALGRNDVADLLHRNLEEEKAIDRRLSTLAEERINRESVGILTV